MQPDLSQVIKKTERASLMQAVFLLSAESGDAEKARNERPEQMKETQPRFSSFRKSQVHIWS